MRRLPLTLIALALVAAVATPAVAQPGARTDRARLIERFPADVRPLLADLPAGLIDLLWEVRQDGPKTLTWQVAGGEFHEGIRHAFPDRHVPRIPGADGGFVCPPDPRNGLLLLLLLSAHRADRRQRVRRITLDG